MIRTCLTCKNYVIKKTKVSGRKEIFPGIFKPVIVEIPSHCTKCNDVMQEWFQKYGDIPTNQLTKDMQLSCYEVTENLKLLDDCINIADNLLEKIKEGKESKE